MRYEIERRDFSAIGSDGQAFLYVPWHVAGLVLAVPALLKGKPMTAVIGVVVPFLALVGTIRLAKPDSWWARRFYDDATRTHAAERFKNEVGPARSSV